ncbi:MAG TPA: AI-2E family transporter [Candidatus Saccharibacteria bacterium]|nr:AI-2E family transporter [Candidatus Saccharibacteria bacterium]
MFSDKKITVSFSYRTIIRVVIIGVLSILVVAFITRIAHILALIFISAFLAVALNPAVSWISKHLKSKSRVRATGVAYLMVLLLISSFLIVVVPTIVSQTSTFVKDLPVTFSRYTSDDSTVQKYIQEYNLEDDIDRATLSIRDRFENVGSSALSTANKVWTTVLSLIIVLTLTFMMLVEGPDWIKYSWTLQNPKQLQKRKRLLAKMYQLVTGYVNGQLLIALIAGTATLFALLAASSLVGGDINAVVFALIVTLTSLIPMFGAMIGAIIVVTLCAFTSLPLALVMAIFFITYQQLENITIQPLIQSWQSEISPLTVFIAALIGVSVGGIIGAFVAIPIVACIRLVLVEYFEDRNTISEKLSE